MSAPIRASELFAIRFGAPPASWELLAAEGSRRQMLRFRDENGSSAVAVIGPDPHENRAFIGFSRAFRKIGLPVPEVLAEDQTAGVYLLEDLGDLTLFRVLEDSRVSSGTPFPDVVAPYYQRVLELLPRFQVEGARVIDFELAHPHAEFDAQAMRWDLQYFKYCFLKLAFVSVDEAALDQDFERLVAFLLEVPRDAFCYRDFQSRNVMIRGDDPWFIDYQGGRRGSLHYDVASVLYDGKAALPDPVRESLLAHYLRCLAEHVDVDAERFHRYFPGFVVLRILQAMGAYGYLGLYQRKPHFVRSIPPAARNLRGLLERGALPLELPELSRVFERIVDRFADHAEVRHDGEIVLRIGSFSYKQGLPPDPGGHGGGFVFDCRALPNPGRMDAFRCLSGLDPEVVTWLETQPDSGAFFARTYALVETQLEGYARRGFRSLQVLFGCTGGQHRSVYLAERIARSVRAAFPNATVETTHHASGTWPDASGP